MSVQDIHSTKAAIAGITAVILVLGTSAHAQTAITPLGSGTQADPYQISSLGHLVWMGDTAGSSAGKHYSMLADIDASATADWNDPGSDTDALEGFAPIGTCSEPDTNSFRGVFNGNDRVITGLVINRPSRSYVGLFGCVGQGGEVRHVNLGNVAIKGISCVGGLVGRNRSGTVSNCSATGVVDGIDPGTASQQSSHDVGGLVGTNDRGTVSNSRSEAAAAADWGVGGLVGYNLYGTVSHCFATGTVTARSYVGGLVGENSYGTILHCHAAGSIAGLADLVGGLAGVNCAGTISACHATGAVEGSDELGGLVGRNYRGGVISNCHATGAVTGDDYLGGLVGDHEDSTILNCYATGPVTGRSDIGGLIGAAWDSTLSYCYATGAVKGSSNVGGLVGYAFWRCQNNYPPCPRPPSYSYWDVDASGCPTSAIGNGKPTSEMKQTTTFAGWDFAAIWSIEEGVSYPYLQSSPTPFKLTVNISGPGSVSVHPASADGTYAPGTVVTLQPKPYGNSELARWLGVGPDDRRPEFSQRPKVTVVMDIHKSVLAVFHKPVQIRSLAELARIGNDPDYPLANVRYVLMADIDASDTAVWNDPGTGTDVLEGFKPIAFYSTSDPLRFDGEFDGRGHTIAGLVINRPGYTRVALVGSVGPFGHVRNLGIAAGTINGGSTAGALVGSNAGTVSNCHVTAAVSALDYSYYYSNVGGGLIGYNSGEVSNCHASGEVVVSGDYAGGLVGRNDGTLTDCHATAAVTGEWLYYVGGLTGFNSGTLAHCYATGAVAGDNHVGGLVGRSEGTIFNCHASGAVTGRGSIGGLLGSHRRGSLSYSHATGAVSGLPGNSGNVGGLIGSDDNCKVSNCYAACAVAGDRYVGGLIGQTNNSAVARCYATCRVTGVTFVGGLVGQTRHRTISDCYASGAVTGYDHVGGLVGYHYDGTVSNCYAISGVSGSVYVGGLIGATGFGSVSNSCWDMQTSGLNTSSGGTGKTTAEMKQQATFAGWDFADVWGMSEGAAYAWLRFAPPPFSLAVLVSGPGSVTADPIRADGYAPGEVVTVTAMPTESSDEFAEWIGAEPSGSPTATVVMDIHKPVMAVFRRRIEINGLADLAKIGRDPAYPLSGVRYVLTADIDASATAAWNDAGTDESILEGFEPIGDYRNRFIGVFDGDGHTIAGLSILRSDMSGVGLFGYLSQGGQVCNLGLADGRIMGNGSVGGLLGRNYGGTVSRCYSANDVSGYADVGGLVGWNQAGIVWNCYATGAATASYVGHGDAGGLVGYGTAGTVVNCYATGRVAGTPCGGLIGGNYSSARVFDSYWDMETSGLATSYGGVGKSTAQMMQQATFAGWDFTSTWDIRDGLGYPFLRSVRVDSDGDGVPDQVDACPGSPPGAVVDARGCPLGDFNHDGTVDQGDLDIFFACMTGPAVSYDAQNPPGGCGLLPIEGFLPPDHDLDGDIDQSDFGILQRCLTEAGDSADPNPAY